jgi:uncharacterized protein (UPF0335 family)
MNTKEIAHLKAALTNIVARVQKLRRQRSEIDHQVSLLYREGREHGIDKKAIKEVLRVLHDDEYAAPETIWKLYAEQIGFDSTVDNVVADPLGNILDSEQVKFDGAVADDVSDPLDRILGPA